MVDRLTFNEVVRDVLVNLYDNVALETHPTVFSILPLPSPSRYSDNKSEYVRQLMLDAIEQLRPLRKEESINSPEWRPYLIIYKRYVEGMGVQELSDMLSISPRQMRRDHHRALMMLTEILWAWCYPDQPAPTEENEALESSPRVEVHNEIIDATETTEGVFKLLKHRFDEKGIQVLVEKLAASTLVITDRVILRQALIGIFNQSLHIQDHNEIQVKFFEKEDQVVIEISARVNDNWETAGDGEVDDDLNAVSYWCKLIHAHLTEIVLKKKANSHLVWQLSLPRSNQRILLVIDDQNAVLNLFKRYLSQTDILPIGVEQPENALNLAKQLRPALITLDVMMPQIDGWELLQHFKLDEQTRHIPVIVCSAWDDPDLSRTLGAAAFLKKPITQKMLLEAIERLLSVGGSVQS